MNTLDIFAVVLVVVAVPLYVWDFVASRREARERLDKFRRECDARREEEREFWKSYRVQFEAARKRVEKRDWN